MSCRVLVTGATGFLGGHCVQDLQREYEIVAVGRSAHQLHALASAGVETASIDLSLPGAVERLVDLRPDVVVHAAALSAPWGQRNEFEAANVVATHCVLRAVEATGCKLIAISTPTIYMNGEDRVAVAEDAPLPESFVNDYAATKYEAEQCIVASQAHAAILRPQAIVGAGDTTVAPRFLRVIDRGVLPLVRNHDPLVDMTHVRNAVQAIELSIRHLFDERWAGVEVFNITNGDPRRLSELLGLFLQTRSSQGSSRDVRTVRLPRSLFDAVAVVVENSARLTRGEPALTRYAVELLSASRTLDITKARSMLGYDPSSYAIEDALTDYFAQRP